MAAIVLHRYSDAEGVWLRASHDEIVAVGFQDEIKSPLTRMSSSWVYLSGDDGVRFRRKAQQFGDVITEEKPSVEVSSIRQMVPYRKDLLEFTPLPGRKLLMNGALWVITRVTRRGGGNIFMERVEVAA